MKQATFGLFLAGLSCFGLSACKGASAVEPQLTYVVKSKSDGLQVTLSFVGEADGVTELRLGAPYGAVQTPEAAFRDMTTSDGTMRRDGSRVILKHAPNAPMTFSYTLAASEVTATSQLPIVSPDRIHALGFHTFAVPTGDDAYGVDVQWPDLPEGWTTLESPNLTGISSTRDILNSVILAGPLDLSQVGLITVALEGDWNFSAAELSAEITPLLSAQETLWNETPSAFTVAMSGFPGSEASYSITGSGVGQGFSARGTTNLELENVQDFLAHETAHNWMPARLGDPKAARRGGLYWFTEGMTEFVAQQAQLESGKIDAQGYAAKVNADLKELYLSPVRALTNDDAADLFWSDQDAERLPYLRGFLLAVEWDAALRRETGAGLMMLFRNWGARSAKQETSEFDRARIEAELLGAGLGEALHLSDWIDAGTLPVLTSDAVGPCHVPEVVEVFAYDLGFDVGSTFTDGIFKGVGPTHNAYAAGLRDGQMLLEKISGGGGATDVDIVLRVQDGGTKREIAYRPVGDVPIEVQQFVKVENCAVD